MILRCCIGHCAIEVVVAQPKKTKTANGKQKQQSNLAAFNIKAAYLPHDDDALVRAKVCVALCALKRLFPCRISLIAL